MVSQPARPEDRTIPPSTRFSASHTSPATQSCRAEDTGGPLNSGVSPFCRERGTALTARDHGCGMAWDKT
jgi:hypothetical protein